MTKYHSDDYIKFLRSIRPDNMSEYSKQMQRCKCILFPLYFQAPVRSPLLVGETHPPFTCIPQSGDTIQVIPLLPKGTTVLLLSQTGFVS